MKKFIANLLLLSLLLPAPQAFPALQPSDKQFSVSAQAGVMANPGFEFGVQKWTASGGTLTTTTSAANVFAGNAAGSWDSSSASQTLVSSITYTNGGGPTLTNGVAGCMVKCASGTCTHTFTVDDGSTNLATPVTITSSTTGFVPVVVNYIAGTGGTIRPKFTSVASNEPILYVDGCWAGSAQIPGPNIGLVAQPQFIGSAYIEGTASCSWSRTNTALGAFSTVAACPGPTVEFNPGPGTIQTTDTDLPKFTVNNLPAGVAEVIITTNLNSTAASGNVAAVAINDGTTTSGAVSYLTIGTSSTGTQATTVGYFNYTVPGNRTFELYGSSSANAVGIFNETSSRARTNFSIKLYPSTAGVIYTPYNGGLAAGDFVSTGSSTCPTGTIPADGSSLLRTDYPALYNAIGTTYGSADGTHFTVPDRRGVFERGAGSQTISSITYTGTQGTTQGDQFQSHQHLNNLSGSKEILYNRGSGGIYAATAGGTAWDRSTAPLTTPIDDGVGGTSRAGTETRPANITAKVCIRTVAATPAPIFVGSVTAPQNTSGNTVINNTVSKSSSYTATATDETIIFTADATLTLPAAASFPGKRYYVKTTTSTTDVTIDPNSSETVCGVSTILVSGDLDSVEIQSDGTNWIGLNGSCFRTIGRAGNEGGNCTSGTCSSRWVSPMGATMTFASTGQYNFNIPSGVYSQIPACTTSASRNANTLCAPVGGQATTLIGVACYTANTGAGGNDNPNITCVGQR